MKAGTIITSRETRTRARIVNFDDQHVIVEIVERSPFSDYRPVGSLMTIYRRGDRWLKNWVEEPE